MQRNVGRAGKRVKCRSIEHSCYDDTAIVKLQNSEPRRTVLCAGEACSALNTRVIDDVRKRSGVFCTSAIDCRPIFTQRKRILNGTLRFNRTLSNVYAYRKNLSYEAGAAGLTVAAVWPNGSHNAG